MRLVFFGVGHWHADMHAHAAQVAGADIVGAWDGDPDRAALFAARFGGLATRSVDAALALKPDLAIVMGRPGEMAELARRFILEGVPMLIEKPVGVSGTALKPVAELAAAHGAFASVALAHRFSPLLQEVAALREADRLGPVSHSHFRLINGPPQRYVDDGVAWVLDPAVSGGGALRNLGIHGVNAFLNLCGEQAVEVEHVSFGRQLHGTSAEDYALVVLRAADGGIGIVEAGYTYASMTQGLFEWRVSARNASLADRDGRLNVTTLDDGGMRDMAATPVARRYDDMMADTIDRLKGGLKPAVTLGDLWRAMDVIDRCYAMAGNRGD